MSEEAKVKCIFCGAATYVSKTHTSANGRRIVRKRTCAADRTHRFDTEESVPPPPLTSVGVRRSGIGAVGADPFDRERLFRDIGSAILNKDSAAEDRIERVVTRTVFLLERNLTKLLQPLTEAERLRFPQLKGSIPDTAIADIVEAEMARSSMRMERLLYALSIRGRQDVRGREGWSNATDVLEWIGSVFPRLLPTIPEKPVAELRETWTVRVAPELPEWVLKKDISSGSKPFVYEQFVSSIRMAMLGRRDVEARSLLVARRVLTTLQGQKVVHTSQLGSGVLTCLRAIDDVAYLRWATILKRLASVTAFTEEAKTLVSSPSPEVSFVYIDD